MSSTADPPVHPLTRIRDFLRAGEFRAAATRKGLAAVLGISRTVLGELEREGKPFSAGQREVVSQILDIDPVWLSNGFGPIRARDGYPWNPAVVPALLQKRGLIGVVNLASSVGLEVLQTHLRNEQTAGRPGPATFGVLKLASELDALAVAVAAAKT